MAEPPVPGSMVRPVKPGGKRDGRLGPPQGYPKDPEKYGDPANWKYPVHTPFHAPAARRYFNQPRNRAMHSPEEQAYIDKKINDARDRSADVQASGGVPHAGPPREGDPPLPRPVAGTRPLDVRVTSPRIVVPGQSLWCFPTIHSGGRGGGGEARASARVRGLWGSRGIWADGAGVACFRHHLGKHRHDPPERWRDPHRSSGRKRGGILFWHARLGTRLPYRGPLYRRAHGG